MQYTMFLTTIIEICKYKMMYNTIIVYTLMIVYLILGEILMESNQRTKNTVFNIYASLIYQIVSGLLNFVVRKVFLIYFSVTIRFAATSNLPLTRFETVQLQYSIPILYNPLCAERNLS